MTRSERLMVERRWAMEIVVLLPRSRAARAELTRVSDSASSAEVARVGVSKDGQESRGLKQNRKYLHQGLECRGS